MSDSVYELPQDVFLTGETLEEALRSALGEEPRVVVDAPAPKLVPGGDAVNHPKHYTSHPSGVEVIEITRHMGFNLGNVIKYVLRADLKGNAIQDLEKALWYLQDEISKRGFWP